jgi:hypothetical protein
MGYVETNWVDVLSGVPRVLDPLLFLIYINYKTDGLVCSFMINIFKQFADDSKLFSSVRSNGHVLRIQSDLDMLSAWAKNSGIKFNIKKCLNLENAHLK